MGAHHVNATAGAGFQLRFESLFATGRALSFPCNAQGAVDLNALTDRARSNYLFARALVGRELHWPAVQRPLH